MSEGNQLTIGSLCSGYGGLDLAVEQFFGARTAWFSEFEEAPSRILAHHWPGVPNLGDMTKIDWATVPKVDIIAGGTPCQDLSGAGKRKGMTEGTRSNLWVQMRESIATIKPRIVIWENVRGAYSAYAYSEMELEPGLLGESYGPDRPALRALHRVLGDLSDLGYDTRVVPVRASDAGAAHARFRAFVIAVVQDTERLRRNEGWIAAPGEAASGWAPTVIGGSGGAHAAPALAQLFPTPKASDGEKGGPNQRGSKGDLTIVSAAQLFPTPKASDGEWSTPRTSGRPIDKATHLGTISTLLPTPRASRGASNTETLYALGAVRDDDGDEQGNVVMPPHLLPTPTASYGGGTAEAHVARKNKNGGNREAVTGLNFVVEESLPVATHPKPLSFAELVGYVPPSPSCEAGTVAEYEILWDSLDDQSPFWMTEKGVDYWPAISRWASVVGRKSPSPTIPDGKNGKHRLNPRFPEWLMGCDDGWLSDPRIWEGLGWSVSKIRNAVLKAAGNGVVTRQALLAFQIGWPAFAEMADYGSPE